VIISHRYRFIFLKTRKTAGTSIETYLSPHCGPEDVLTSFGVEEEGHVARNHRGLFNPFPELFLSPGTWSHVVCRQLPRRKRYRAHMKGYRVRARTPRRIWDSYFKFCVERNPWDRTLSHFHMLRGERDGALTFDEYLEQGLLWRNLPIYTERRDKSALLVDRVVRYERLDDELGEVFGRLGIPWEGSLGVRAKGGFRTDRRPYQEVYTDEQRAYVAQALRHEIRLFGYTY